MLIDVHGHIGALGGRVFSIEWMRSYVELCGVQRVLVSNLDGAAVGDRPRDVDELDANVACLEVCRAHSFLAPVYWVRPGRLDSNIHAFAGALESEPFVGAFFSPPFNRFEADDTRLDPYLAALAKLGKPALVQVGVDDATRPERIHALGRRHPRTSIVLCNVAGNVHWKEALDVTARAKARDEARLLLETADATAADVVEAVQAAGADRVVYGSDATRLSERHGPRCREVLASLREALPPEERARVLGGTAGELFRLPA
jgi:predicted TIM-barrel fold metal-dependent hydrolase